jgi:flagellar biogenesis protein FliO
MLLALLRMIGALALVLALFFGGLWLFRHWQRLAVFQGRSPKLAVIEAKSLGQRHTLYLVGYEQQRMLIAASPGGVTMLTALPEAEHEVAPASLEMVPVRRRDFGGLLLQALGRRT